VTRSAYFGRRTANIDYEGSKGIAGDVAGLTQWVMNQERLNGSERIVGGSKTFSDSKSLTVKAGR
jgi:hypothetical protein